MILSRFENDREGNRKYLTESERIAFYKTVMIEPDEGLRAFGLTLFYTGCRISEALNTPIGRIDSTAKAFVFETLKQRKRGCYRAIPIPKSLVAALRRMVEGKQPSDRVWTFSRSTAYRFIKRLMVAAGIEGSMASPKGLRHSFAVASISQSIPLTTVQKWMGHARLDTTAIYLNVSGKEERELARRLWKAD